MTAAVDTVKVEMEKVYYIAHIIGPRGPRTEYTVRHPDGRVHIQVTSKDEVRRLVRKHYGTSKIEWVTV